jgi:hypothetical protein
LAPLEHAFSKAYVKLQETTVMINSVVGDGADSKQKAVFDGLFKFKKGDINRVRLMTRVKGSLDKMIADLESCCEAYSTGK